MEKNEIVQTAKMNCSGESFGKVVIKPNGKAQEKNCRFCESFNDCKTEMLTELEMVNTEKVNTEKVNTEKELLKTIQLTNRVDSLTRYIASLQTDLTEAKQLLGSVKKDTRKVSTNSGSRASSVVDGVSTFKTRMIKLIDSGELTRKEISAIMKNEFPTFSPATISTHLSPSANKFKRPFAVNANGLIAWI